MKYFHGFFFVYSDIVLIFDQSFKPNKIMKVLNSVEADNTNFALWKVGELTDIKYSELVRILGEPTYNEESGDGKTQVEWWILLNEKYFTIYDWKTYNREFTLNGLDVWSIGGSSDPTQLIELINSLR